MRLRNWAFLFVLMIAAALVASPAAAQINTADLSGTVYDPQSAVVPGAKVTARNLATGATRTTETDSNGVYRLVGLPPGRYELTIVAAGFARSLAPELVLTIGQSAVFNPTLTIAAGAETVTVEDSATELIETARTAVAETIDSRRITNLPINGRNYVNFTLLTSQAQRDSAPSIGAAPTSGLNFGGQRARSNMVSVDGADAVDNSVNGIRATVSQEAVQEFQLIISNYMPEFGRATGGVVNIVTKGGSNEVHGNVFGYLRHKSIQARNPFSVEVNPSTGAVTAVKQGYTRVQAGATIGGPIQEDKTWYFLAYETSRRQETGFTNIGANNFGLESATFPFFPAPLLVTPQQRAFINSLLASGVPALQGLAGQYGVLAGSASNVALNRVDFGAIAAGSMVAPCRAAPPFDCFPIPVGGVSRPLPASYKGLRTVGGNYPLSEGTSLWSARFDHQWNDRNNSFLRLNVTPSTVSGIQVNAQNQNFGQNAGSATSVQQTRDLAIVGQHVSAFTDSVFNETRFQFSRRGLHYGFSDLAGGSDVRVQIPGFAFFGREPFSTVDRIERRYQWTNNLTWLKGRHTIKTGGDVNLIQLRSKKEQIFELNFGGLYNFGGLGASTFGFPSTVTTPSGPLTTPGFTAVQAYGLGLPSIFVQGIGNSNRPLSNKAVAWFLQDSWKITPKFTLNFGVRYDLELLPIFSPATALNQAAEPALNVVEGIPTDRNNWAPRAAIAWDPWGRGNTVIRAGYGIFYDHPLLAVAFNSTTAEGALSTQLITFGGAASATAIASNPAGFNAASIFQGVLNTTGLPNVGYLAAQQRFDPKLPNSFFTNHNFINLGFPIGALPFTLHVADDFKFGYAQQGNLTVEQRLWKDYKVSVGYTYTHGLKLNRPRNINVPDPAMLVRNAEFAIRGGILAAGSDPRQAAVPSTVAPGTCVSNTTANGSVMVTVPGFLGTAFTGTGCSAANALGPVSTAAAFNFFRPSGPNPSFGVAAIGGYPGLVNLATMAGYPTGIPGIRVPWGDVVQQESSGNSVYHGLTVGVSKRFANHFEFLSSYTWSHAIDDSTDLQTLLAPQDNRFPNLERGNSTFDQRHRWVSSAVIESPWDRKNGGINWLLADWVVAPIFEVASGRPFAVLTGSDLNLDFGSNTDRPSVVTGSGAGTITSPFIPGVTFGPPDICDRTSAFAPAPPFGCRGNLGRNVFTRPGFVNMDLRISRKFWINEQWNFEFITDIFNLANKFNVGDVNVLCNPLAGSCTAGEPTAALDPRQFQFALKVNW